MKRKSTLLSLLLVSAILASTFMLMTNPALEDDKSPSAGGGVNEVDGVEGQGGGQVIGVVNEENNDAVVGAMANAETIRRSLEGSPSRGMLRGRLLVEGEYSNGIIAESGWAEIRVECADSQWRVYEVYVRRAEWSLSLDEVGVPVDSVRGVWLLRAKVGDVWLGPANAEPALVVDGKHELRARALTAAWLRVVDRQSKQDLSGVEVRQLPAESQLQLDQSDFTGPFAPYKLRFLSEQVVDHVGDSPFQEASARPGSAIYLTREGYVPQLAIVQSPEVGSSLVEMSKSGTLVVGLPFDLQTFEMMEVWLANGEYGGGCMVGTYFAGDQVVLDGLLEGLHVVSLRKAGGGGGDWQHSPLLNVSQGETTYFDFNSVTDPEPALISGEARGALQSGAFGQNCLLLGLYPSGAGPGQQTAEVLPVKISEDGEFASWGPIQVVPGDYAYLLPGGSAGQLSVEPGEHRVLTETIGSPSGVSFQIEVDSGSGQGDKTSVPVSRVRVSAGQRPEVGSGHYMLANEFLLEEGSGLVLAAGKYMIEGRSPGVVARWQPVEVTGVEGQVVVLTGTVMPSIAILFESAESADLLLEEITTMGRLLHVESGQRFSLGDLDWRLESVAINRTELRVFLPVEGEMILSMGPDSGVELDSISVSAALEPRRVLVP